MTPEQGTKVIIVLLDCDGVHLSVWKNMKYSSGKKHIKPNVLLERRNLTIKYNHKQWCYIQFTSNYCTIKKTYKRKCCQIKLSSLLKKILHVKRIKNLTYHLLIIKAVNIIGKSTIYRKLISIYKLLVKFHILSIKHLYIAQLAKLK